MSALRPAAKQARMTPALPIQRTESSVTLPTLSSTMEDEGERGRRIASLPAQSSTATPMTMVKHPRGHRVTPLQKVCQNIDSKDFLSLGDTLLLSDYWFQPIAVEPSKGAYTTATFREIFLGPNIKTRTAKHKVGTRDILNMLYLCDCMSFDAQNVARPTYDEWFNEKLSICIKELGREEGGNDGTLCNFIITKDKSFTFYPSVLCGRFATFFRKICYHSYKASPDCPSSKIKNLAMIKCGTSKGKFDYVLEGRFMPFPDEWFDLVSPPTM